MDAADQQTFDTLVAKARKYLKRYQRDMLNGKDAEDFAIETMLEGVYTFTALKRNIIDAARAEMGRTDRGTKQRNFFRVRPNDKTGRDGPSELEVSESFKDFQVQLPDLKDRLKFVAECLAQGKEKKQIAKELQISKTMVTHLINDLTKELAKDSEWKNKLQIFQKRNPSSSERLRNTQF